MKYSDFKNTDWIISKSNFDRALFKVIERPLFFILGILGIGFAWMVLASEITNENSLIDDWLAPVLLGVATFLILFVMISFGYVNWKQNQAQSKFIAKVASHYHLKKGDKVLVHEKLVANPIVFTIVHIEGDKLWLENVQKKTEVLASINNVLPVEL